MSKINLVHVRGNSFYCDGVFSVGVYRKGNKAILIDTGSSKEFAKELSTALEIANLIPVAILTTHCHGDHCGGHALFQQKHPNIRIYSTEMEKPFIEDPLLAPLCFCCGAAPFQQIKQCKPITPQEPSKVTDLITPYEDQMLYLEDEPFFIVTLPGHTRGMIGVLTPDDVLYCGDALFGPKIIEKHPILYYTFIKNALSSFCKLSALEKKTEAVVLYHGGLVSSLLPLIQEHENRLTSVKEEIVFQLKKQPLSIDEITAHLIQIHSIPSNLISYTLTKTSIQAFLADLEEDQLIELHVTKGICKVLYLQNKK